MKEDNYRYGFNKKKMGGKGVEMFIKGWIR